MLDMFNLHEIISFVFDDMVLVNKKILLCVI